MIWLIHLGGLLSYTEQWFEDYRTVMTVINLATCAALLVVSGKVTLSLSLFAASAIVGGWWLEAIGVHTGFPFGTYTYGEALGPKVFEVPLTIGLAWYLNIWGAGAVAASLTSGAMMYPAAGIIAVAFDLILEVAAPLLDYWSFASGIPPLRNYLAWFAVTVLGMKLGSLLGVKWTETSAQRGRAIHIFAAQTVYCAGIALLCAA